MQYKGIEALFYLAVNCQHSANQLKDIEKKYSPYIDKDKLTPDQKIRKEQIEADLYPYLNTFENQKRFLQLCELCERKEYLKMKFLEFLVTLQSEEFQEFLLEEQKKYNMRMELAKITEIDQQQLVEHMRKLLEYIDKEIAALKKQIEQLQSEIKDLKKTRDSLIESVNVDLKALDEVMVQVYSDFAQSTVVTVEDVGGFKVSISDSVIGNLLKEHFKGKIISGEIPVEKRREEEVSVVSKFIRDNLPPRDHDPEEDERIKNRANKIVDRIYNAQTYEKNEQIQNLTSNIMEKQREIAIINVGIKVKENIVEFKKQDLERLHEQKKDIQNELGKNKISKEWAMEITQEIMPIEKTPINAKVKAENKIYSGEFKSRENTETLVQAEDELDSAPPPAAAPDNDADLSFPADRISPPGGLTIDLHLAASKLGFFNSGSKQHPNKEENVSKLDNENKDDKNKDNDINKNTP